jgi:hypothetical protein
MAFFMTCDAVAVTGTNPNSIGGGGILSAATDAMGCLSDKLSKIYYKHLSSAISQNVQAFPSTSVGDIAFAAPVGVNKPSQRIV